MKKQTKLFVIAMYITNAIMAQSSTGIHFNGQQGLTPQTQNILFAGQWLRIPFEIAENADSVVLIAEMSDASGSFSNPKIIGTFCKAATTGQQAALIATIPQDLPLADGYRIRVLTGSGEPANFEIYNIKLEGMKTWFADNDGDGLGDPNKSFVSVNDQENGFVQNGNDTDDSVFNNQIEITGFVK